jgi:hypothetical protein
MATKKKQVADSDSDDGDESNSDNDEMDVHEYRKFLSQIFPSKHLSNKIKAGEKLKKVIEEVDDEPSPTKKGSAKSKNNKNKYEDDEDEDEDEICDTESEEEEDEELVRRKSKKSKKSKKAKKSKRVIEDSDDEEDDESEEEDDDDEPIKNKNLNIIFTIGGMDEDEDEWEDCDDSDYEDEDDEDDVTEDEDEEVSTDEDDEEEEDDEDEEEENIVIKKSKKTAVKNNSTATSMPSEASASQTDTLQQLRKLLEANPNDKSIKKCISVYEDEIKTQKVRLEKKETKQKDKNMRIFKRIIKDKNTMNDFSFYEKLEVEQQKKIIKEAREINKITRIEKPYRMTLLESTIPVEFKSAAMKKINSLKYMEPGSGEFYKSKN